MNSPQANRKTPLENRKCGKYLYSAQQIVYKKQIFAQLP